MAAAVGTRQHRVYEAVVGGRLRRVKVCRRCGEAKVAEEGAPDVGFFIAGHYRRKDGVVTPIFNSKCKACREELRLARMATDPEYAAAERARAREAQRRSVARDPERARAACRRYYHRIKAADPEGFNEMARMNYTLRRERQGKTVRRQRTVIDGTMPRVPAAPFQRLVEALRARYGCGSDDLGVLLGLSGRQVRFLLAGRQESVALDVVDRALLRLSLPVEVDGRMVLRLDDLFPLEAAA